MASTSARESALLPECLYARAIHSEFTCHFRRRQGSQAIRDNRATWHCAFNDYHRERRPMHRVTVAGDNACSGGLTAARWS